MFCCVVEFSIRLDPLQGQGVVVTSRRSVSSWRVHFWSQAATVLGSPRLAQAVTVRVRKAYPQVVDHVLHWVEEPVGQLAQHMPYAPEGSASQNDPEGHVELPPHREAEPFT